MCIRKQLGLVEELLPFAPQSKVEGQAHAGIITTRPLYQSALGMVHHVHGKDGEAAHTAMAKLDHGFRMDLCSPDNVTIPARFVKSTGVIMTFEGTFTLE